MNSVFPRPVLAANFFTGAQPPAGEREQILDEAARELGYKPLAGSTPSGSSKISGPLAHALEKIESNVYPSDQVAEFMRQKSDSSLVVLQEGQLVKEICQLALFVAEARQLDAVDPEDEDALDELFITTRDACTEFIERKKLEEFRARALKIARVEWKTSPIDKFTGHIPSQVLAKALALKKLLPKVSLTVHFTDPVAGLNFKKATL